ncbi:hypothetical protein MWU49_17505 [Alcanivorax sp. S6407]|uniref:hypothetical protein n=1 Tax=Alcanivorax sp. S6407 TaxID=2926424 RepID=UPI001FF3F33F|nr:hypothetical protein [Alcanivorax sp. S6407]MCK0155515.1 hypothetical protein [Alcanivorax sp. S6407]
MTLQDQTLMVPEALPAFPVVLVIGFSKPSMAQTKPWLAALEKEEGINPEQVYRVAVLESVPALVRGFVVSRMRSRIAEDQQHRFLVVKRGTAAWQSWVGYTERDDAYLLVLGGDHGVIQRVQGPVDENKLAALKAMLSVTRAVQQVPADSSTSLPERELESPGLQ